MPIFLLPNPLHNNLVNILFLTYTHTVCYVVPYGLIPEYQQLPNADHAQ